MSKVVFKIKKYESKGKKGNRKTEDKRKNDIIEIGDDNDEYENDLNENFTKELLRQEEKKLNNENDNDDITTFMDGKKHNYPHYNNIKSDNILSKYIININIFNYR
jgi:hypothetical protein